MDRAAAAIRAGEGLSFDVISSYEPADLAYEVAIQGGKMSLGDAPDTVSVALRVTTIFRREADGRKLVHRHADPITGQRRPESLVESSGGSAS